MKTILHLSRRARALQVGVLLGVTHFTSIAQLPNAWQINDNSGGATGGNYNTNLPAALQSAALTNGWHYTLHARLLTDYDDTATMLFLYGVGTNRFSVYLDLDDDNNITATPFNQPALTLTDSGSGSTYYHTYEMVYNPATRRAAFLFDGIQRATWDGDDVSAANGLISWGSGSSGGRGWMHFHAADFKIGTNVVAAYDAGTQNNPTNAPDPRFWGWAANGTSPATTNEVSPDVVSLPSALGVMTLPATDVTPHEATINGIIDLGGLAALAWFQWGTTTNYGNTTTPLFYPAKPGSVGQFRGLFGLPVGTTFHFRCVATNVLGIVYGQDFQFATPPTFEVTTSSNTGPGSLRQAIIDALPGDNITFGLTGKITLTSGQLDITKNLNIIGPGPSRLELNGNFNSRVFSVFNGVNFNISGLTIRNGRAPDGGPGGGGFDGGGIYNAGTLTLSNCVVTSNWAGDGGDGVSDADDGDTGGAGGDGGGIYNAGTLTLLSCDVTHNHAGSGGTGGRGADGVILHPAGYHGGSGGSGGRGGGIFSSTAFTSVASDISNNDSGSGGSGGRGGDALPTFDGGDGGDGGSAGSGGGAFLDGSATLTNCQLDNNGTPFGRSGGSGGDGGLGGSDGIGGDPSSPGFGGGVLSDANATFTACNFNHNEARWGGAFGANSGTNELIDCSLVNNDTELDGGGIYINPTAAVVIRRSLLGYNHAGFIPGIGYADGDGGGIFNRGTLRLENSTMVGNLAESRGGAIHDTNSLTLINCTVVGNTASISGGISGSAFLTNTIVTTNTPAGGVTITGSNNRTSGDPQLAPLANYGGLTMTRPPLPGSPVVNAGLNSVTNFLATDQRGYRRRSGASVDIGAAELQQADSSNPPLLQPLALLPNGSRRLNFTDEPDIIFSIYASTNVAAPTNQWLRLGAAAQIVPGQYQYVDLAATNYPHRFYKVVWP